MRDLRGGLAGLRIFLLCIALGVAAIVGVESLAQALNDGLGREGRVILGGDASFSLIHRRLSPDEQAFSRATARCRPSRRCAGWPEPRAAMRRWWRSKPSNRRGRGLARRSLRRRCRSAKRSREKDGAFGAAAEEALLARLNLKLGDVIRIGEAKFVLRRRPDQRAGSTGGRHRPRAPRAHFAGGARRDGAGAAGIAGALDDARHHGRRGRRAGRSGGARRCWLQAKRAFPQAGWEARSRLNVSPDFSRDLDRFAEFLTLAGLLSLVVGGVGVANAAQGFVERKRATLAILKAIGATGTSVVALALLEFSIVALIGALAGAALGAAIPFAVDWLFASLLPIPLAPSIEPSVIALGLAMGF